MRKIPTQQLTKRVRKSQVRVICSQLEPAKLKELVHNAVEGGMDERPVSGNVHNPEWQQKARDDPNLAYKIVSWMCIYLDRQEAKGFKSAAKSKPTSGGEGAILMLAPIRKPATVTLAQAVRQTRLITAARVGLQVRGQAKYQGTSRKKCVSTGLTATAPGGTPVDLCIARMHREDRTRRRPNYPRKTRRSWTGRTRRQLGHRGVAMISQGSSARMGTSANLSTKMRQ